MPKSKDLSIKKFLFKDIFVILVYFHLFYVGQSINIEATFKYGRQYGIIGSVISAQDDIGKDPEQYFLCGFAFREMMFKKILYNCNCGFRVDGFGFAYKCDYCNNEFWTMSNAFQATFCHYSDWSNQIVKTYETGNTQSGNWRSFMCPQETYGRKAAVRLGRDQETDIGFVGMQLTCSSKDLTSNYKVQDDYKYPLGATTTNPDRTFISGVQLKSEQNGKLTGISLLFERMAVVSSMKINYIQIGSKKPTKKVLENIYLGNNERKPVEKVIGPVKTYEYQSYWSNLLPHVANYIFKEGVVLQVPQLNSTEQGIELSYREEGPSFRFDTQITKKLIPTASSLVSLPQRSVLNATVFIEEFLISQAYEVTLVFSEAVTGKKISEKLIKGIYTGANISNIKVSMVQDQMKNIWNPSVYYTYFPTGEIDSQEYLWTDSFGGWAGKTETVEVPYGYWLVGIDLRCGWNIDAISFEYTSNQKDLISRGQYGGKGGVIFPTFRANYTNDEWITKMNIWHDNSIVYGMQIITNKGIKSSFCGRSIATCEYFDARWYKRWVVNSYPFLYNFKAEFFPNTLS